MDQSNPSEKAKLLFIGTGCSEGIPNLSCLFNGCKVCESAMRPDSKNHRLNISICLQYKNTTLLIDISLFSTRIQQMDP